MLHNNVVLYNIVPDIVSSQCSQLYLHSEGSDQFPPPVMTPPVWPSSMDPPKSWFNSTSIETAAPTSHYVTTQQNSVLRTILGRQDQSKYNIIYDNNGSYKLILTHLNTNLQF
jgi:hypothetical protein